MKRSLLLNGTSAMSTGAWVSAAVFSMVMASSANAAPSGGVVQTGTATIAQTGNVTDITQTTAKAVINWGSFDTTAAETVNFLQPNASSATLNRVSGPATNFDGMLNANGNVWIVNSNGILFGSNAKVNVGGLLATTANISDANFNSGTFDFNAPGTTGAFVRNRGSITVADGGLAALVAPGVENSGVIQANLGKVLLGGASTYTIDPFGDGMLNFSLKANENVLPDIAVSNTGSITAQGGQVYLSTNTMNNVVDNVINISGFIDASSVGRQSGIVSIDAGASGTVRVSDTIDASGNGPAERAGTVSVAGANINLLPGAFINTTGGGTTGGDISLDAANQLTMQGAGVVSTRGDIFLRGINSFSMDSFSPPPMEGSLPFSVPSVVTTQRGEVTVDTNNFGLGRSNDGAGVIASGGTQRYYLSGGDSQIDNALEVASSDSNVALLLRSGVYNGRSTNPVNPLSVQDDNISIQGISGNAADVRLNYNIGVFGDNFALENVTVAPSDFGVVMGDVTGGLIRNNQFAGGTFGVVLENADGVSIVGNRFDGIGATSVGVVDSKGVTVASNVIRGGTSGIDIQNSEANVTSNNIANLTGTGIALRLNTQGSEVTLNTVDNTGTGIAVIDSDSNLVKANYVVNSALENIYVEDGKFNRILSNAVVANRPSGAGFLAVRGEGTVVDSNTITGAGRGIWLVGGDFNTLVRNSIDGAKADGINASDEFGLKVLSNEVRNTDRGTGIVLYDSAGAVVDTNIINGKQGVVGTDGAGISIVRGPNTLSINNIISNTVGNGIELFDSDKSRVLFNKFSSIGQENVVLVNSNDVEVNNP